jgi:hypothetical protein
VGTNSIRVESSDDIAGQSGEVVQCHDEGLARQEIGLVDRYLRGDLNFCFCPLRDKPQYGFILYADKISDCVSAWNKDPVFGVIGIQSGPRG